MLDVYRCMSGLVALAGLLAGPSFLAACGGASDAPRRQWRFALEEIQGSVQDRYAETFKKKIEERTGGKIHVEVYPYGTLGTSSDLTELVQTGAVELAFASPGHLGSVIPEVQVFLLHFVFSDDPEVNYRVLSGQGRLRELLSKAYREHGLALVTPVAEGWMAWTANRDLRTPADFSGLKIRTMTSPLLIDVYQAYGADPTPMPYSEVYSGLQLHMIDAQVNPVFAIEEMSFYEVQKYLVQAHHLPFVTTLVANPAFLDGLPPDQRKIFDEVEAEMRGEIEATQRKLNAARLATIRKKSDIHVEVLGDAERAAFRKRSLPVRDRYVELAGPRGRAVLDALLSAVAEQEKAAASSAAAPQKRSGRTAASVPPSA